MDKLIGWFMGVSKKHLWIFGGFVSALVVFNFAFVPSTGWLRLFWNLLGYFVLLLIYRVAEFKNDDIGLARRYFKSGIKYGAIVITIIGVGLLAAFLINSDTFKDPRYHQSLPVALYSALVLLPLKTVLFEELAFRGIMPALLLRLKRGRWLATIISSVAFGFWHIISAATIGSYSAGGGLTISKPLVIVSVWLFTSLAGVFLCELRWRSKSLIAPIIVHWFVNAATIILASLSWRI